MRKYDDLWNDINTLLFYLRSGSFDVVKLVNEHFFVKYGNEAPGLLLAQQIEKLQKRLDEAPANQEDNDE
jgi:hypothetical protein